VEDEEVGSVVFSSPCSGLGEGQQWWAGWSEELCKCGKSHGDDHRTLRFLLLLLYLGFDHFCSVLYTPPCLRYCNL